MNKKPDVSPKPINEGVNHNTRGANAGVMSKPSTPSKPAAPSPAPPTPKK